MTIKKYQRWSEEEVAILKRELEKGTSVPTIANMLNMSINTVASKKKLLGLKVNNPKYTNIHNSWSENECKVFCKVMVTHWSNLSDAARLISMKINRTPTQVMSKWYYLKGQNKLEEFFKTYYSQDFEMCFLSIGKNNHMVNAKISTGESTIIRHKVSFWKKLLNLFK